MVFSKLKKKHHSVGKLVNKHKSLKQRQCNNKSTITFLIKCRHYGITPNFLTNSTKNIRKIFSTTYNMDSKLNIPLDSLMNNFHLKVLNLLIKQKHDIVKYEETAVKEVELEINKYLTIEEQEELWKHEKTILHKRYTDNKNKHINKFLALRERQKSELNLRFNENWFINKTNITVPEDISWLLSLGPKHAIPTNRREFPLFKFIADGEDCIQTIAEREEQEMARTKFCSMLDNYINKQSLNIRERHVLNTVKQTRTFLNKNKNLLILNADKGNITVAMDKKDYDNKMNNILGDMMTYKRLTKDPTTSLQRKNNELVEELYKCNIISMVEKKRLKNDTAMAPRIYGLPKIHKENFPLRPICSSVRSPSVELCKFVMNILKKLTIDSQFNVRDAVQFKNKINNSAIGDDERLISFDVVSLFPSIPVDFAMETIDAKWEEIKKHTNMTKELFMKILRFCVKDNRYFKYNDKVYTQYKGLPMGSPASPIVADIVMEELLKTCVKRLTIRPRLLTKYVDDLFGIIHESAIEQTLTQLNSFHQQIKFTMEEEENGRLPYLDTVVIRNGNQLKIDWYQKPTSSGRITNFYSCQPKKIIINTAVNLIRRVLTISDKKFHGNNIRKIKDILMKNSFPENIVNSLIYKNKKLEYTKNDEKNDKIYKSITYVPGISERVKNSKIYNDDKFNIAPKAENTLNKLFSKTKSKVDKMDEIDLIYQIKCNGNEDNMCGQVYVGTTKNKLRTRISGHKSDIKCRNKLLTQKTALAAHCAERGHTPNFEQVKILQRETKYNKRFTLEMLHIINTPLDKRINFKSDTDNCAQSYRHIINKNKNYK